MGHRTFCRSKVSETSMSHLLFFIFSSSLFCPYLISSSPLIILFLFFLSSVLSCSHSHCMGGDDEERNGSVPCSLDRYDTLKTYTRYPIVLHSTVLFLLFFPYPSLLSCILLIVCVYVCVHNRYRTVLCCAVRSLPSLIFPCSSLVCLSCPVLCVCVCVRRYILTNTIFTLSFLSPLLTT